MTQTLLVPKLISDLCSLPPVEQSKMGPLASTCERLAGWRQFWSLLLVQGDSSIIQETFRRNHGRELNFVGQGMTGLSGEQLHLNCCLELGTCFGRSLGRFDGRAIFAKLYVAKHWLMSM